jgi:hypothetical protein
MAAGSSANTMLVVIALGMTALACGIVAIHMHPELLDSAKNWFSHVVRIPS